MEIKIVFPTGAELDWATLARLTRALKQLAQDTGCFVLLRTPVGDTVPLDNNERPS